MNSIHQQIASWKKGLLSPNKNDVLLNIIPTKNAMDIQDSYQPEGWFSVEENVLLKKIIQQHNQHLRETGSPIFGIAKDILSFELAGVAYNTPFLLASAHIQRNRFNATFEIQQVEDFFINPLLLKLLQQEELTEETEDIVSFLSDKGLTVQTTQGIWVANYHPHRFVLQKEFDELLEVQEYSNSVKGLLGETCENNLLDLPEMLLYPADESQLTAMELVKHEDVVIQGPPGTGKSQVIANLIGKTLGCGKSSLLVAEKPVALQVIYDQLKRHKLHYFSVLYHHELQSKQFIGSLKRTWKYLEKMDIKSIQVANQSHLITQQLDLNLARLQQTDLIGGISFIAFKSKYDISKKGTYILKKPSLAHWQRDKEILVSLEQNGFPLFSGWKILKIKQFSLEKSQEMLEKSLSIVKIHLGDNATLIDLQQKLKLSNYISLFYYNDTPLSIDVFQKGSKTHASFVKSYNALKSLVEKEKIYQKEEEHWKKKFSLSELNEYILALTNTKLSYSAWKTKKHLLRFTNLNMVDGKKMLENLQSLYQVRNEIIQVKERLRKNGLPDELTVLDHIQYTLGRLEATDENALKILFSLSQQERNTIQKSAFELQQVSEILRTYFNLSEEQEIYPQLLEGSKAISLVAAYRSFLQNLSDETLDVLSRATDLAQLENDIYYSHWIDFKGQYPSLASLQGRDITQKIEEVITHFDKEAVQYAEFIQQLIRAKFESYHQLLQTPSSKLDEEQRAFKKVLKKGKSILINAFDKKRVFPTVRELLESEAVYWIQVLHPVFLCSPYSVSKSLPITTVFDLVIFDEASQIPLGHAIGSIQRAKRAVICGDQQQMAPQFYFQKLEYQQSDVLHHASFYWKNAMLTHHYRSQYSQLIAFSNQYFYQNKLKTFPLPNIHNAIECVTLNGVYADRKNKIEAKYVAKIIEEKLQKKELDFGVVAFSQTQLEEILHNLPMEVREEILSLDDVFIQSLENVQGDQCQHLIISLGYGKDENGDFAMRFGPLNQEQGHRRLNVLMSRAIQRITFIRSVTSEDFTISDNEGVEALRKLMLFLENLSSKQVQYIFSEGIHAEDGTIFINDVSIAFPQAQELIDFYRTFRSRGWEVKIEI
ncbi:MAG: ATP-binding protein [Brumimicrobium sp.]|nr:ATP-binding protein [Brumimicrobium sp.]